MANIRVKSGTRAQLNAAAAANQLNAREPYLIADEGRFALGTSASAYASFAKEGEGGGVPVPVTTMTTAYTSGRITSVTEDGVTTTIGYDGSGRVSTVSYPHNGLTRTETYTYNPDSSVSGMTATEA